jgi:thioredoxin-related protein
MPKRSVVLVNLLVLVLATAGPSFAAEDDLGASMVNPGYHEHPAWFKQSFLDIRDDVGEAADNNKRVLLYFYQDGCPYCKKLLETNFSMRDLSERTQNYFDVIAINMWGDREVTDFAGANLSEKQFAADLKVMFTPTMLLLNEQGEVVVRLNGYYPPHKFGAVIDFVGQRKEKTVTFREYWARQSPVAASGKLHRDSSYLQPPYRLADRPGNKPLLVLFEQKICGHCDELHGDILKRKESAALLQQFDVLLLDMWSDTPVQTPAGQQTTAAIWSRELGVQYVPSMVIFDKAGDEVFRTEAYLKSFHIQSALEYVLSGAYREQPSFQRFVQARADALEAQGIHVDLMD